MTPKQKAKIETLVDAVSAARSALQLAELALHAARCDAFGVHTGDLVRGTGKCRDGIVGRVVAVEGSYGHAEHPWVTINPRKKDGSFSSQRRNLFSDWEHVT